MYHNKLRRRKKERKLDKGGDEVGGREGSRAPVEGEPSKTSSAAPCVLFQGPVLLT